jgi:signal transduction histidine kinase
MKLSSKISLIAVTLSAIAVLICCFLIVTFTKQNTVDNLVHTGVADYGRFLMQFHKAFDETSQNANDMTMRSYIIYTFKGCYGSKEYTLQQGEDMLVNNTGLEAQILLSKNSNPVPEEYDSAARYSVVTVNDKTYLIMGSGVWMQNENDYFLSLVRDVSEPMDNVASLTRKCIFVCVAISAIAAFLLSYFIYRALKPLKKLSQNAERIADGAYDSRLVVSGKDEIAALSGSFNHMAESIEQHVANVEATSEERRMLLAALSHEMKTPVTAIVGYSHALTNAKLTEEQKREAIYFIDKESRRLERLSGKLTQLISFSGMNLSLTKMSCASLRDELISILSPIAKSNGIILHVESGEQTLNIELDMIICLVTNLFDNARKAGAKHIDIFVGGKTLRVADDGKGIPKNQIHRITQPFYTLDQSRTGESFGLGLALARQIAELHHAKLMIESEENKGTTIRVVF